MTFTKLFSSITESTIWAEADATRIVWITMLAMADHAGRVWASIPGLANRARVSLEDCESALETLQAPDHYSRTQANDGRRIEPIDGGWRLLNHAKYRSIRDAESIKQSKRDYINRRRGVERSVENVDRGRHNAEAEAEAEADKKPPNPQRGKVRAIALPDWLQESVWQDFKDHRQRIRKPLTRRAEELALSKLEKLGSAAERAAIVNQSIENGWAGLFPLKSDHQNGQRKRSPRDDFQREVDEMLGISPGSSDGHSDVLAEREIGPAGSDRRLGQRSGRSEP